MGLWTARRGLVLLLLALAIPVIATFTAPAARADGRPNIIVVQTDDQDAAALTRQVMPKTVKLLRRKGTTFTDYVDSGPLCCPSRAVMLTGQYGHNNGVTWDNPDPYGDLREKRNTLPVWLHRAGYRTAHLGKYLNLYAKAVGDPNEVAPGWDEWHTVLDPVDYYDYVLRENGRAVRHGEHEDDYLTTVLNDKAVRMIHRYVPHRRPLFMAVDQFAPHASYVPHSKRCHGLAVPAPGDDDLFKHEPLPTPPSFNEADVSDKPSFVQARHSFQPAGIELLAEQYRCRLASLREVDRGVKRIVGALRSEHELGNTAIVFTSDNGWLEGEHRIPGGKVAPYEEDLHTPLVIRLPKAMRRSHGAPRRLSSTVANIDLAPTLLQLAGAKPCSRAGHCRTLDGRSLLKAIRTDGRRWPKHRGILLELEKPGPRAGAYTPCHFEGVRTSAQVYVEYHSATERQAGICIQREEVEHYDLRADPFELDNTYPAPTGSVDAALETALAARVDRLRDCAGIEGRDPEPPSGHYCE